VKTRSVAAFLLAGIFLELACSSVPADAPSGAVAGASGSSNAAGMNNSGGPSNVAGASSGAGGVSSSGAAGASSAGVAGSSAAGAAGSAAGGATSHMSGRSSGCGKPLGPADSPTAWVTHNITVTVAAAYAADFSARVYFTRPPKTYNPDTAYPLTVWGQGCGQTKAEETQIALGPGAAGSIQVQLLANPKNHDCYSAGPDGDHVDSPELPYFDAVLAEAEAAFCIDTSKVYMGGWSSGGWITSLLSCTRTNVIKGVGWASAGLQLNHPECVGPMAAILERGVDDGGTSLPQTEAARESLRLRNGCSNDTEAWDPGETAFDTSTCVSYKGCMPGYPLVWCPIPGGHNNGGKLSQNGFWKFWTALP
jgi:hypothetical protein